MTKFVYPALAMLAIVGMTIQRPVLLQAAMLAALGWAFLKGRLDGDGAPSERTQFNQEWTAAAEALGFGSRPSRRQRPATMRGQVDGLRANVICYAGAEPEIEVRFESGLRNVDIDRRRDGVVRLGDTRELSTGDPAFDELYRISAAHDSEPLRTWLTAERRDVLITLAEALNVREIEEDELEVKLGTRTWVSNDLVEAVRLCAAVARVLDTSHVSSQIQDAVMQDAVVQRAPIQDAVIDRR